MDLVLDFMDPHLFTPYVYPESWPENYWPRQLLSLFAIALIGGLALYLGTAALAYHFLFDKRVMDHPLFLRNQIRLEIATSMMSAPLMVLPTALMFLLEVRGLSRLYDGFPSGPSMVLTLGRDLFGFLFFTDMMIYWIHRLLHHRLVYKYLHKLHHKWKIPTPFASHAFHPVDGFLQSLPYHLYPFLFPLNKVVYLTFFVFVNMWTVSIHDGYYSVPDNLKYFVNGSAHHTDHHLYYDYNYGQYFTLWDRLCSSFKDPSAFNGRSLVVEAENKKK
ncbi:lathosterol oxidase-like [Sycon ciliatum]|uniref:lathosterol oxidase-like n=1 Tax=Sycon ciliatum TaxID=27933 RepID=UPI0020A93614|eukprot:scpid65531/ scgid33296/ Lathosterol oxidase; C-5 sterol desaturase; Delta(7)-sterol 5-desaturase; Lathosterol 5-desaturase; Sterol-C5-desaturase